jgi:hypothetical protein
MKVRRISQEQVAVEAGSRLTSSLRDTTELLLVLDQPATSCAAATISVSRRTDSVPPAGPLRCAGTRTPK